MITECPSGVKTPNFSEMKVRHLTLAERRLSKNKIVIKLFRAPYEAPSKNFYEICLYVAVFHQSQAPPLHFTKIQGSNTTWKLLRYYTLSKVGRNSLPKHEFLRDCMDNSTIDWRLELLATRAKHLTLITTFSVGFYHGKGWGEPTCTLVHWRQEFKLPTRNECMGWPKSVANWGSIS